jgi:hypothetical protein
MLPEFVDNDFSWFCLIEIFFDKENTILKKYIENKNCRTNILRTLGHGLLRNNPLSNNLHKRQLDFQKTSV